MPTEKTFPFADLSIKSYLASVVEKIDEIYTAARTHAELTTGLSEFDALTGRLRPANLIVIAGRPSMGKTTLALNIVEHVAADLEKAVIFFSLESDPETLALRLMCSLGRIDAHKLRTAMLDDEDWPLVTQAVEILAKLPIYINNVLGEGIAAVYEKAKAMAAEDNVGLVVIDSLQALCCSTNPDHKTAELSSIVRQLKIMAQELNIPVIAVSQLNRDLEQRADKRPVLSDLKDAAAIEDDADLICFVYRDEYYVQDSPDKGLAELIIAKHRNGPTGVVKTVYCDQFNRFENLLDESDLKSLPELNKEKELKQPDQEVIAGDA